jgi:hypothetical protein
MPLLQEELMPRAIAVMAMRLENIKKLKDNGDPWLSK